MTEETDKKDSLRQDIKQIETDIKSALRVESSSLSVSPELANEQHRDLVFLKRKLEKAKLEYAELL